MPTADMVQMVDDIDMATERPDLIERMDVTSGAGKSQIVAPNLGIGEAGVYSTSKTHFQDNVSVNASPEQGRMGLDKYGNTLAAAMERQSTLSHTALVQAEARIAVATRALSSLQTQ